MGISEEEFLRNLQETFKIEAEEHLQSLSNGLLELENQPEQTKDSELINTIFREAHSLKGAARAVNHTTIQDICQSLESVLSSLRQKKITLTAESFDVLYSTIDLIKKYVDIDEQMVDESDFEELQDLTDKLNCIAIGEPLPISEPEEDPADPVPLPQPEEPSYRESPPQEKQENIAETIAPPQHKQTAQSKKSETEKTSDENQPLHEQVTNTTIRVSTGKLDKLLQQIEEMLTLKLTSRQRVIAVEDILKDFEKWNINKRRVQKEIQTLRQLTIKQANSEGYNGYTNTFQSLLTFFNWQEEHLKVIEDKIIALRKETAQDYRISGSIVDNLLEETKEVLMQPCQTLFDAFPRMIRDISRTVNKEIKLEINGADIEIDRRILEEMKDPLIHLIRNSIDHGIESPEDRISGGKARFGTLTISVTQVSGSNVDLSIKDDGSGINIEKVKASALQNNVVHAKDLEEMTDQESLMLMFQSGVSTSEIITDLSGRGVGLGVVNEKVEKLGGKIYIETKPNEGTEFRIRLPLTLATFRGVHILVDDQGFIIPTHYLIRVLRIHQSDINTIEGKETISFNGKNISFVRLKDILGIDAENKDNTEDSLLHILVIKASETVLAICVDKILNEQEVFIKGLGKQLTRVKNIADATVMEWGKVIPILDPFDIVKTVTQGVRTRVMPRKATNKLDDEQKKNILIAEDTVTARMLLKNILDSSGYNVKTAVDGVEAYSLLAQEDIDLLLSDIEMPRMSGFELTEKVRSSEKLKDLPIVLCSSLCTKEDKEKGVAVGANAYIVKSSFEQSNLLETIQKLL